MTYGLEAVAVVIGLFGLSSSFGALVLARRRDFESVLGLTAVLAHCCADRLIAVGTTAMRPVWPATPLRPLEPGG